MSSFSLSIAAGAPIGLANSLAATIDANLPAALAAAALSGDPLLDGRVSTLLRAIGGPSSMVTGKKTFLGGRLGTLLNSITPSMAARLARRFIGKGRNVAAVRHTNRISLRPTTRTHSHGRSEAVHRVRPTDSPERSLVALTARSRIVQGTAVHSADAAMPASATSGKLVGDVPSVDESAGRTPLGWPWDKPLPAIRPPSECAAGSSAAPAAAGQVLDLFA